MTLLLIPCSQGLEFFSLSFFVCLPWHVPVTAKKWFYPCHGHFGYIVSVLNNLMLKLQWKSTVWSNKVFSGDLSVHTAFIWFWILKRQAISKDNGFMSNKMNEKFQRKERKEISQFLSDLPASWSVRLSQKGWLGLAS